MPIRQGLHGSAPVTIKVPFWYLCYTVARLVYRCIAPITVDDAVAWWWVEEEEEEDWVVVRRG